MERVIEALLGCLIISTTVGLVIQSGGVFNTAGYRGRIIAGNIANSIIFSNQLYDILFDEGDLGYVREMVLEYERKLSIDLMCKIRYIGCNGSVEFQVDSSNNIESLASSRCEVPSSEIKVFAVSYRDEYCNGSTALIEVAVTRGNGAIARGKVLVEIYDPKGEILCFTTASWREEIYECEVEIPSDAEPGEYTVKITYIGEAVKEYTTSFRVKLGEPLYRSELLVERRVWSVGETVKLFLSGRYQEGAEISYVVYNSWGRREYYRGVLVPPNLTLCIPLNKWCSGPGPYLVSVSGLNRIVIVEPYLVEVVVGVGL